METGLFLLLGHEMDLTISHSSTHGAGSQIIDYTSLICCFLSKQPETKLRLFHGGPNEKGQVSRKNGNCNRFFCCQIEEKIAVEL